MDGGREGREGGREGWEGGRKGWWARKEEGFNRLPVDCFVLNDPPRKLLIRWKRERGGKEGERR